MQHLLQRKIQTLFRLPVQKFTDSDKKQISTDTGYPILPDVKSRLKTKIKLTQDFISPPMKISDSKIQRKSRFSGDGTSNHKMRFLFSHFNNPVQDIKSFRKDLYQRHRLSHQQIDDLLGEQQHDLVFEEKIEQLGQVAWFLEVTAALRKADIWFVAYKGPLLSYRIYKDSTCRRFKDFDFLVKPDKVQETIDVLGKLGFSPRFFNWPSSRNKEKRLLLFLNQYTLDHPLKEISVEIHWSLVKYPAVLPKKMTSVVNENLQLTTFAGKQFNQFTLELELLHLVIHGGLHTWSRLKWLLDIHEIVSRFEIDKIKFENLVEHLQAKRLVGLCNALLSHFFPGTVHLPVDYPVPEWFVKYSLKQINRSSAIPVFLPEDLCKYRWYHIQAFPNWRHRLRKVFVLFVFFIQCKKRKLLQLKLKKTGTNRMIKFLIC